MYRVFISPKAGFSSGTNPECWPLVLSASITTLWAASLVPLLLFKSRFPFLLTKTKHKSAVKTET